MGSRTDLQEVFEELLGSKHVYFQPPESIKLVYPCIIYSRSAPRTIFADDQIYSKKQRYTVTVLDKDPDSLIPEKVLQLPFCRFDRHFCADNLNHDIYDLYY